MRLPFAPFLLGALGVTAGMVALAAWPAYAWEGREGLVGLGLAGGICLLGALAGRFAQGLVVRWVEGPTQRVTAMNAGLGARLLATLGMAVIVIVLEPVRLLPFAVWLGLCYVALLCLEVFVALREFGQNPGSIQSPGGGSEETPGADSAESRPEA